MRLKLTLSCRPNSVLAYEHHHALRAVIYKIIQGADPVFSEWLHECGYELTEKGSKRFKLFNFGLLTGLPFNHDKPNNCLVFPSGKVEWYVSFCVDKQVEKFVEGLFKNQTLEIVAAGTKVIFNVQSVQLEEPSSFTETMRFRAKSGICLTEKTENDRYAQFRSPADATFEYLFFNNLKDKVSTALKHKVALPPDVSIKILTEPKKWSAVVPNDNGKDTRTIGYRFDFEITAPAEWLRIAYFAGFGRNCSGGFGFCEILT
jgi:CRISPR-associated endoribonuclease Cas6